VNLEINGRRVTVPPGTSVMRAAAQSGIAIPKLCATDLLEPFGSCRLCIVEIQGKTGYPASCTTPVEEGMIIRTDSPALSALRRNIVELYLSDHPAECADRPSDGNCELHTIAAALDVGEPRYGRHGDNHLKSNVDASNPYFVFDPAKCIVCARCVRACEDIQGTFALTIDGRGFASLMSPGQHQPFADSECVSCGACVQACPTDALIEKSKQKRGQPDRSVVTTCGYCGVGCSLRVETNGDEIVRIVPDSDGRANHGHACIKGRFAWEFSSHPDRVRRPLVRDRIDEPWREVSWDEAIAFAASGLRRAQDRYGRGAVGVITSSRCTNEETYLVQKMARTALRTNNVDNCARVCHAPSGYGLKLAFGTSAATQDFDSVVQADVIMIIGANVTEAHPVFGARIKQRAREGAKLIVIDPRTIEIARSPHVEAAYHLKSRPGSNIPLLNSMAHVIVTEKLFDEAFVASRCDVAPFERWKNFVAEERNSPEALESITGVAPTLVRQAARTFATAGNGAIYYGLGITEHSQGSTAVLAMANLAMATGNIGRPGTGLNPLRGQNNVQGACDMGSFPDELTGYRKVSDRAVRASFEAAWRTSLDPEPGLRMPAMWEAACDGKFKAIYIQGEDVAQSEPNARHVAAALRAMDFVIVQDLFLNETAKYAHVLLPGASFLEKDGTFTNAERRVSRIRKIIEPLPGKADWQITCDLSAALGYPMNYAHPSEIMDEIARLTPTFAGLSYDLIDRLGGVQWPCNQSAPAGTPILHGDAFVGGKGKFTITGYTPTPEKTSRDFPLTLITGRILSQYNVGTQTRRTPNETIHREDVLEMHPADAGQRGIRDGAAVEVTSHMGSTRLHVRLTERVQPGVVYATFHHPESHLNDLTSEVSDWATQCPEYKVTAVRVVAAPRANGSSGPRD